MDHPVAIVTGAGRGIGRAAAVELAQRGYRLALASRHVDELEETCRLTVQTSTPADAHVRMVQPPPPSSAVNALAIPADMSVSSDVDRLISKTLEAFGRIDAVVHCAGVAPSVPAEQMTDPQWHEVIDTNLSSAFYLGRAVWPTFRAQRSGVIVNISSTACRDPFPGFAAYAAAKAGLNMLSLVLAREGAPIGVRVHTIAPGAVETAMFRALRSEEQWPREKTLDPAAVARVIAQCVCGDLRYTSGEVIFLSKTV